MATEVDLRQLFEAGVHVGHFRSRRHPNMSAHIHSVRQGRCVIDLVQTKIALENALTALTQAVASGQTILFVGTKRQSQEIVKKAALQVDMPYVIERWVGGLLTNYATINIQIQRLRKLEAQLASGELAQRYNKLEVQNYQKQADRLNLLYGGMKNCSQRPNWIYITDMFVNTIAVDEANKLKMPIIGLADTNVDPRQATYPIYANDDALQSLQLITDLVLQAISSGLKQRAAEASQVDNKTQPVTKGE